MNEEYQVLVRQVPDSWWEVKVIKHSRELLSRIPHDIYIIDSVVLYEESGITDRDTAQAIGHNFIRKEYGLKFDESQVEWR